MATLLGSLRVRLTAETEDFRRGLATARQNLGSFQKDLDKFRNNTLANVASIGALGAVLRSSINVANQYDNAQRQLAATAKLTGIQLGFLEATSKQAQDQFKLSAISANGFTTEMSKLASKAGDVGKASTGLAAFLDIGAARGLSADQTLKAVQQSILGIDEGTDKLFSKNPSVLYAEYAAKIGTTAGKLTDQQKAQALLDAAMTDGAKVRGEYQKWLQTSQGQQYLLSQGMEQTQAVLGKALQPALVAIIPVIAKMAEGVQVAIRGWQMLGATLGMVPGLFRAAKAALSGNFAEARKELSATTEAWRESIAEITSPPPMETPKLDMGKLGGGSGAAKAGKATAKKFFDSLASEWENLKHSVALTKLEVSGTDPERLALEEAHALKLLDIEAQQLRERHKLKELDDYGLAQSLKQIETRRQIAQARRSEMEAARTANAAVQAAYERQGIMLSHTLDMERLTSQSAIARLGAEASVEEKLRLQLELSERTYQLQRAALLADTRLTDEQLNNELLKLDLAKQREQVQLRMAAATEKESKAAEKRRTLRSNIKDSLTSIGVDVLSGRGTSVSEVVSGLGSVAGSALGNILLPGIGGALGGALGSSLGKLFGKKDKKQESDPVVRGLSAIERAVRETITTIAAQTDALLNPEGRLYNLPSTFNVPNFAPAFVGGGGGTTVTYGDTNVSMQFTVNSSHSPEDIRRMAYEGITKALNTERGTRGWY